MIGNTGSWYKNNNILVPGVSKVFIRLPTNIAPTVNRKLATHVLMLD